MGDVAKGRRDGTLIVHNQLLACGLRKARLFVTPTRHVSLSGLTPQPRRYHCTSAGPPPFYTLPALPLPPRELVVCRDETPHSKGLAAVTSRPEWGRTS